MPLKATATASGAADCGSEQVVAGAAAPAQPALDELLLGRGQRWVVEIGGRGQHRDRVEVQGRDALRRPVRHLERDRRPPVALQRVALVAEHVEQREQPLGDPGGVERLRRGVGERVAGQRRHDHVVARVDEPRDQLDELDRPAGPAVNEHDRKPIALAASRGVRQPVAAPARKRPQTILEPGGVVGVEPMGAEIAQVADVHPRVPADPRGLGVGPARAPQALVKLAPAPARRA